MFVKEQLDTLEKHISILMDRQIPCIVAIDGPCGSGKSTLAGHIQKMYPSCCLFHCDDFFLQAKQRTAQRLLEPGGNMDRERLYQEVILGIKGGKSFDYHRYDCQSGQMVPVMSPACNLAILEGSYSLHPDLQNHYDLRVFIEAPLPLRLERLMARVGPERIKDFLDRWIPMEDRYFQAFQIRQHSDVVMSG